MRKITLSAIIAVLSLISAPILAQVTIAPTNLFIDGNTKFGTYMVINGSNQTQEIAIDFFFAYAHLDDNGIRSMVTEDPEAEAKYSIADEVKAFPKNFKLAPGQRQVVRLRISGGNDLADGTYWSRIKTASSPETPPLEIQSNDAVTARVGITVEQVTGLFYKKGETTTGIAVDQINPSLSSDKKKLSVKTNFRRLGNSPFLGSITTSIINSNGEEVRRGFVSTSLYFDGTHLQDFEIEDLPQGTYTIQVTFESNRSDVSSRDLVQMETVTKSTSYTIQ
ncbi:molecular chaperone [Balneola vulgaris]|uniref:molecular chaperone n=1 Tax=Balneola vulgaris TaxID=287535 RepID=UPI00036B3757|nr:molecular chaperone [Balneola vulgaris]